MQDKAHAMAMERVGEGIIRAAEAHEKALDAQIKDLENLGELELLSLD